MRELLIICALGLAVWVLRIMADTRKRNKEREDNEMRQAANRQCGAVGEGE